MSEINTNRGSDAPEQKKVEKPESSLARQGLLSAEETRALTERQRNQNVREDQKFLSNGVYGQLELTQSDDRPSSAQRQRTTQVETKVSGTSVPEAGAIRAPDSNSVPLEKGAKPFAQEMNEALANKLNPQEFATRATNILHRVDADGGVTREQLAKALQDPSFKGRDAQTLAALYTGFDDLVAIPGRNQWNRAPVLTRYELDEFARLNQSNKKDIEDASTIGEWARSGVVRFDNDGDKNLNAAELQAAIGDPSTSAADRQVLRLLNEKFDALKPSWQSGVSRDDIKAYEEKLRAEPVNKLYETIRTQEYRVREEQGDKVSRELFGGKNLEESITPDAVQQGSIGNCYFMAALSSVAASNPSAIRDAIQDNHDGTYTVTFPGAKGEPITVSAPTEAESGMYAKASAYGTWPAVMEKAYGQYSNSPFRRSPFNPLGGATPQENSDGGAISSSGVLALLTGSQVDNYMRPIADKEQLSAVLTAAFSSNPPKAVTAGLQHSLQSGQLRSSSDDGFAYSHAYSITNFVSDGAGGGMVTVRNPWGDGEGPDGTTTISLDKFLRNFQFSQISVER